MNLSIKPPVKNCLCVCVCILGRTLLRLRKEGGEQGRIDKRTRRRNEVTLFLVFCIPLFIITSTIYYLFAPSFSLFFFSHIHLQYDYKYKRIKESKIGILFLTHSAISSQLNLLLIDVQISTVHITISPHVALSYRCYRSS